ncbi:MAG TPA: PAS domain S-box protein [Stellaceae bacterium]|nr:PAS domain S-box protein [Stellaceae bacterium]
MAASTVINELHGEWALTDVAPVALYTCDRDGRVVKFNRRAAEIWGCSPDLGDPERRFCGAYKLLRRDGSELPRAESPMAEVLRSGHPIRGFEVQIMRPDGQRLSCLLNIEPLVDAQGGISGAVASLEDITSLQRASEETCQTRERRWRELLEALPAAIYTTDAEGRITFYNRAAAELAGRQPRLGSDQWCVTWRLAWPDGTPMAHEECPMAVTLKENREVRGVEALAERPDGTRVPFVPYPTPLRDQSGAVIGAVNMLVDVSAQKRTEAELRRLNESLEERVEERRRALLAQVEERRKIEAQLHQSQKMEAVGQLTGGIAHDFNNLLTTIMSNLDLIEARTKDAAVRRHAAAAMRATQRGAKLTHQLLAFSRKQFLQPRPSDINELVTGMSEMLLRTLGGTVRVELALADGLWPALIDPSQIESALLNLAINARDAMPEGGTLTIETANVRVGRLRRVGQLEPGDYVMVAVADTGTGMSEDVKARAFDPFFTTKEIGRGSGLGLSQVYGTALQSGGSAEIDTGIGRGTTVRIHLPRARARAERQGAESRAVPELPLGRRERVLVVDDDEDVRVVVVDYLRELGYGVDAAASGGAALQLLESRVFDLVVMDFAMPGMHGVEAGRIIEARRPGTPILFITGHAETTALKGRDMVHTLLRKPFVPAELEAKIRFLLQASHKGAAKVVPLRSA